MNILFGIFCGLILAGLTQLLHLMIGVGYPMAALLSLMGLAGVCLYFLGVAIALLLIVQYRKAPYGK